MQTEAEVVNSTITKVASVHPNLRLMYHFRQAVMQRRALRVEHHLESDPKWLNRRIRVSFKVGDPGAFEFAAWCGVNKIPHSQVTCRNNTWFVLVWESHKKQVLNK